MVTHSMRSTPLSSPTIVGNAVENMLWSSEESSIVRMRPAKISRMWRVEAGAVLVPGSLRDVSVMTGAPCLSGREADRW